MKSATSFFEPALLKKDLTRFWPIWALYTLVWTYALPVRCLMQQQESWRGDTALARVERFAAAVPDLLLDLGIFLAFTFGILAAMAMFSYLYNTRSACMIHALPVRREGLFLTHYTAGLVCLLAPHAVVWLLTLAAEGLCGYVDLYTISVWLLAQSAMCLFAYSFAVFCAMFTGHLLALPAFYGILNFLVFVMTTLVSALFEPFLYGYSGLTDLAENVVLWLTPAARLAQDLNWVSDYGRLEGTTALAVYAAAGLVFAVLALLVYRQRHLERAGDVVAVALVRPIFKYGVAVCAGLCLGCWLYYGFGMSGTGGLAASLMLWTAIGYFVAEMLLKKSFRVLRAWKGCAVLLVCVALGVTALHFDLTGYAKRIPAADQVQSVALSGYGTYPYDDGRQMNLEGLTDPETIQSVLALHRAFVEDHFATTAGDLSETEFLSLTVTYKLRSGATLSRRYSTSAVGRGSALAQAAEALYCDPAVALANYGLDEVEPEKLTAVTISNLWEPERRRSYTIDAQDLDLTGTGFANSQALYQALYQAVRLDFEQGALGRRYLFNYDPERLANTYTTDLVFHWEGKTYFSRNSDGATYSYSTTETLSVTLTPQAANTLELLTRLGVLNDQVTLRTYGDMITAREQEKDPYPVSGSEAVEPPPDEVTVRVQTD